MTDTEAGAALVALGPPFRWTEWNNGVWDSEPIAVDGHPTYEYVIMHESDSLSVWFSVNRQPLDEESDLPSDDCPDAFALLELAKAACERHYATGQWF